MKTSHRLVFGLILAAYALLAVTYSIVTPIFEASDELWHYPMVKTLADSGLRLPIQNPADQQTWRQEGSQPPLYYFMAAILTSGIDTSDMDRVRRINPHADIGIIRPDGNANMIVHPLTGDSERRGTVLAVHIARLLSVALGLGTVLITYLLARELFPDQPYIWLGAAALNAFLPMFLFIAGSVNNDNLSNLLGNWLTLLIVRLLKHRNQPPIRTYMWLGIITGAGLLAKLNIGFLIPIIALSLLILSLRLRSIRPILIGGLISGALTIAIAGWWYLRNYQLYGDPTGLNVFLDIVGRRAIPANAAQLWAERHSFTQAYWGFFGGVNVPLPDAIYVLFNFIGLIGLVGTGAFILYTLIRHRWTLHQWLPPAVTLIWIIVTFVSYLRWTAETPASQGRLIFGALSSLSIWLAVGLTWWLPRITHVPVLTLICATFAIVATAAPFNTIAPAYGLPDTSVLTCESESRTFAEETSIAEPRAVRGLELLCGTLITEQVRPEEYVHLRLDWRVDEPVTRDWSLFVHLVTPDGVIISQRDIYPGTGSLATTDLPADYTWHDTVSVWVPPAAYAPMTLDVVIGWYHLSTGERMTLIGAGDETLRVGTVELLPRASTDNIPNPININFANLAELIGYEISDLTPSAGNSLDVTLYWRRINPIPDDYVVFVHIIDPATLTIYGGSDAQPAAWTIPTSTWGDSAIITDTHTFTVNASTPPGIYELEIGMYIQRDDRFDRLRVVTADGGMANDYAYLSRVRVLPAESETTP